MDWTRKIVAVALTLLGVLPGLAQAQATDGQVIVDASPAGRRQVIDGFGTTLNPRAAEPWYQALLLDDLRVSIARMDMSPRFAAPYSDAYYHAPSFDGPIHFPGADNNNVRTYTGPSDYGRLYGSTGAPIAVMGPNIDENVKMFNFDDPRPATAGRFSRVAQSKRGALGDYKLFGTVFSPAPWLKIASGNVINAEGDRFPPANTPFPFIWNGNFSGGALDISDRPLEVFNDGTGPTSALTQYARSTAAYLRGFQISQGVKVYALSIQNELGFEQFYDSCGYPRANQLAAALKSLRRELSKYPDLAQIRLIGPEDLLIDSPYSLWQFGSSASPVHKNVRYLHELRASDPEALAALDFIAVHGEPQEQAWRWFARGWSATPQGTLPARIDGFTAYGRKSWMTETSGSESVWPRPGATAESGALQVAINIHRALTVGEQSAWLHWQLEDGTPSNVFTLTDRAQGASAPKYVAAKHFFRSIRPNAVRVEATQDAAAGLHVSAYVHDANRTVTVVLINASASPRTTGIDVRGLSSAGRVWSSATSGPDVSYQTGTPEVVSGRPQVTIPAFGIVTLQSVEQS
ncbi:MAG: hypothetical protein ABW252_06215 [Polyangiales bacterium]